MNYEELYNTCHENGYKSETDYAWYRHFLKLFESLSIPYDNILDVGCSIGNGVKLYNDKGITCDGVDVSSIAVDIGKKRGLNLYSASCTNLPFENEKYDIVISSDMLEHLEVYDVDKGIEEIFRVSKKYIGLKIPIFKEPVSKYLKEPWRNKINKYGIKSYNLHLTVLSHSEWMKKFTQNRDLITLFNYFVVPARCFIVVFAKKTLETILIEEKSKLISTFKHYQEALNI